MTGTPRSPAAGDGFHATTVVAVRRKGHGHEVGNPRNRRHLRDWKGVYNYIRMG